MSQLVEVDYQDNELFEVDEDRSTPAPLQVKPESPIIRSGRENAIIVIDDDSDVEFLEERIRPTRPKKEPSDGIVDMTMVSRISHVTVVYTDFAKRTTIDYSVSLLSTEVFHINGKQNLVSILPFPLRQLG
jgi:hypothetical protein